MLADTGDESIQLRAALGVVQCGRREQTVGQLAAQTVTLCHVELLFAATPDQIEAPFDHLLCGRIGE